MADFNTLRALLEGRQSPSQLLGRPISEAQARTSAVPSPFDAAQSARDAATQERVFGRQREQIEATEDAQQAARLSGFDSPQAFAEAQRQQEAFKVDAPVRAAEAAAQGRTQLEEVSQRGIMEQIRELARAAQAGGAGRSLSVSGVGSVGAPPRPTTAGQPSGNIPQSFFTDVSKARQGGKGVIAGLQRMLGMTPIADSQLKESLVALADRKGSLDLIHQAAQGAIQDGLSPDEAVQTALGAGLQFDPNELELFKILIGEGR